MLDVGVEDYHGMSDLIFLLLFLVFVVLILGTFSLGGILAAPWVPVPKKDINRLLRLSMLKPGDMLIDLGCGDGRILIAAALGYKARCVGYEVALLPFLACYFKILKRGLFHSVNVQYANFYKQDLSSADVVTAFLSPRAMEKLRPKFQKELSPNTRIVSYAFRIPDWEPTIVDKPSEKEVSIFVYKKPFAK